jgi:hypothetical protein
VFVEIAYVFNCRSFTGRAVDLGRFSSRWLVGGVALTVALQLLSTHSTAMNDLFGTAPIAMAWLKIIIVAVVAWGVVSSGRPSGGAEPADSHRARGKAATGTPHPPRHADVPNVAGERCGSSGGSCKFAPG